jgi:hypothetical protein
MAAPLLASQPLFSPGIIVGGDTPLFPLNSLQRLDAVMGPPRTTGYRDGWLSLMESRGPNGSASSIGEEQP